ncbi:MAG: hypothetical protein GY941_27905 [Planctomycetes bacterium]|nr:hypothetical protein [Planctomycetota bacterium]
MNRQLESMRYVKNLFIAENKGSRASRKYCYKLLRNLPEGDDKEELLRSIDILDYQLKTCEEKIQDIQERLSANIEVRHVSVRSEVK